MREGGRPALAGDHAGAGAAEAAERRRPDLPDPHVAVAWFGLAHFALATAALVIVDDPALLAATFYHPRLLAALHLLTLGWIGGSILGALLLVPGMAMRARVPPHRADLAVCAAYAGGLAALTAGFALSRPVAVVAGGIVLLAAAGWVLARALRALRRGPHRLAWLPFAFGAAGFALAGAIGVAVAVHRAQPWLPGPFFAGPFAHAHLAALGGVLPIVLGAGYRLLPMLLPAAVPPARRAVRSAAAAFGGGLALAAGLLLALRALVVAGGVLAALAVLLFVRDVAWMRGHRRPAPAARPRPDLPLVHVAAALVWLVAAVPCGVALLVLGAGAPPGLRAAYAVLALLGGFGQLVAGVAPRLLGWLAWLHAFAGAAYRQLPPTPYALLPRALQRLAAAGWLLAVPALAAGAGCSLPVLVRAGGVALLAGVVAGGGALAAAARAARAAGRQTASP